MKWSHPGWVLSQLFVLNQGDDFSLPHLRANRMLSSICQVAHLNDKQASMWTWHMVASPSSRTLYCSVMFQTCLIYVDFGRRDLRGLGRSPCILSTSRRIHLPLQSSAMQGAPGHGWISNTIEPANSIWKTLLALAKLHLKSTTRAASTHSHIH